MGSSDDIGKDKTKAEQQRPVTTQYLINTKLHGGFQLGELIVQPDLGLIIRNDERHHVPPKAMEVLLLMSSYAGEILSRETLLNFAWGDENASKSNLSHVISELRHALNDHKECPTYIQTLPRKGYRLLMPAIPLSEGGLGKQIWPLNSATSHTLSKPFSSTNGEGNKLKLSVLRSNRLIRVSGAYIVMAWVLMQVATVTLPIFDVPTWGQKFAVLLLVIGFPVVLIQNWLSEFRTRKQYIQKQDNEEAKRLLYRQAYSDSALIGIIAAMSVFLSIHLINRIEIESSQTATNAEDPQLINAEVVENAIAILPFVLHGGGDIPDYFIAALQSELTTFLSQAEQLKVTSERAVADLPKDASLQLIRNRFGVKYVLEGRARVSDGDVKVTSFLTDSSTGYQVWTGEIAGQASDLLSLHENISKQVINALHLLLPEAKAQSTSFSPTDDFRAYDLYVQGKAVLRDAYNEDQYKEAEGYFLRALNRDSEFGLALSALCQTYLERYDLSRQREEFELAVQACQKAMSTRATRLESEIALGNLYLFSGQYLQSEVHFKRAVEMEPKSSPALVGLADVNSRLDRNANAEALYKQAIQAEPGYWRNYQSYGSYLFVMGRYQEASHQYYRQTILQPQSEQAFNNLGAAYYMNTDAELATRAWTQSLNIRPNSNNYSNLGTSLFFSKQFEQAADMYQQSLALTPGSFVVMGNLADTLKYIPSRASEAKDMYEKALLQAQQNAEVNPKDLDIQSVIVRFMSELDRCEEANTKLPEILAKNPENPYIFYDLALTASNCPGPLNVSYFLHKTLEYGYPQALLQKDHQFERYQIQLADVIEKMNQAVTE